MTIRPDARWKIGTAAAMACAAYATGHSRSQTVPVMLLDGDGRVRGFAVAHLDAGGRNTEPVRFAPVTADCVITDVAIWIDGVLDVSSLDTAKFVCPLDAIAFGPGALTVRGRR